MISRLRRHIANHKARQNATELAILFRQNSNYLNLNLIYSYEHYLKTEATVKPNLSLQPNFTSNSNYNSINSKRKQRNLHNCTCGIFNHPALKLRILSLETPSALHHPPSNFKKPLHLLLPFLREPTNPAKECPAASLAFSIIPFSSHTLLHYPFLLQLIPFFVLLPLVALSIYAATIDLSPFPLINPSLLSCTCPSVYSSRQITR